MSEKARRLGLMTAAGSDAETISGAYFIARRKVFHIPADNGIEKTAPALNYIWNLCGVKNTRQNQLVYFRYLSRPEPVQNMIRSIGPNSLVLRYRDTAWEYTAVGDGYDGVLPEGDVECLWFELK